MHDTHMIEKIYQSIVALCQQNGVKTVTRMRIEVDESSHLDGPHLLAHLYDRDSVLFTPTTEILLSTSPLYILTAIITNLEGESDD